ncbi:MAG: hypothetical protein M3Y05_03175 [Gemmatimonadota bacterium]|nr:hypothetical protein [Gemmatimonadota bacterium]
MIHGIILGGGALLGLSAALFSLATIRTADAVDATAQQRVRYLGLLTVAIALLLWLTVLVGTYIDLPPYRATPLAGLTDLGQYPEALLKSNPDTKWLHSFAMEIKEHVPWISAMLATAIAFVGTRYRSRLLTDSALRSTTLTLLAICFVLVAVVSLLGMFINKVAPLQ